jgi:hypothetical protein
MMKNKAIVKRNELSFRFRGLQIQMQNVKEEEINNNVGLV